MLYKLTIRKRAIKVLEKIDEPYYAKIKEAIYKLDDNNISHFTNSIATTHPIISLSLAISDYFNIMFGLLFLPASPIYNQQTNTKQYIKKIILKNSGREWIKNNIKIP